MTLAERAENAQKTLFGRYDQLNAKWEAAEKRLRSMHIPREVSVPYLEEVDEYGQPQVDYYIGLVKYRGEWRICTHSYHNPSGDSTNWTPITEASAETRVELVQYLPKLHEAVVKSAEDFIGKVDEALKGLDDYLSE